MHAMTTSDRRRGWVTIVAVAVAVAVMAVALMAPVASAEAQQLCTFSSATAAFSNPPTEGRCIATSAPCAGETRASLIGECGVDEICCGLTEEADDQKEAAEKSAEGELLLHPTVEPIRKPSNRAHKHAQFARTNKLQTGGAGGSSGGVSEAALAKKKAASSSSALPTLAPSTASASSTPLSDPSDAKPSVKPTKSPKFAGRTQVARARKSKGAGVVAGPQPGELPPSDQLRSSNLRSSKSSSPKFSGRTQPTPPARPTRVARNTTLDAAEVLSASVSSSSSSPSASSSSSSSSSSTRTPLRKKKSTGNARRTNAAAKKPTKASSSGGPAAATAAETMDAQQQQQQRRAPHKKHKDTKRRTL